jgi:hypothetical protein
MGTSTSLRGHGGVKALQEHQHAWLKLWGLHALLIWLGALWFGMCDAIARSSTLLQDMQETNPQ